MKQLMKTVLGSTLIFMLSSSLIACSKSDTQDQVDTAKTNITRMNEINAGLYHEQSVSVAMPSYSKRSLQSKSAAALNAIDQLLLNSQLVAQT